MKNFLLIYRIVNHIGLCRTENSHYKQRNRKIIKPMKLIIFSNMMVVKCIAFMTGVIMYILLIAKEKRL